MASERRAPVPERVGRYDVLLPIASGGMATVYLARSRGAGGFEREVALKLTHAHLSESTDFAEMLLEEAKLAVRIRHPNVVPVLDVGDDPLGLFLVMEYVEGDSMSGLLAATRAQSQALPAPIGLRILVDALNGLHAAHELRDDAGKPLHVVHRDFSPQNILVGLDGAARLTDFGIAKAATRLGNTITGTLKGKIGYMAPEQVHGGELDRRCDVWAAGVIAWQLITGKKLFSGDNDAAVLLQIATKPPPRLKALVPAVPSDIDEVVAGALKTNPLARTRTAAELSKALTRAARAHGMLAEADEVGAFVKAIAGPKIASRRARAVEVERLRAEVGALVGAAPQERPESPYFSRSPLVKPAAQVTIADAEDAPTSIASSSSLPAGAAHALDSSEVLEDKTRTDTTSVSGGLPAELRRASWGSRRARIGGALGVGALAVLALAYLGARDSGPAASPAASATAPPPPPPAAPSAAPIELPPSYTLTLRADALVGEISVDGRVIPMSPATREPSVTLTDAEHEREVRVVATSTDGHHASVRVPRDATSASLTFNAPAVPRAARPLAAPPAPKPAASAPPKKKLAGDPYER